MQLTNREWRADVGRTGEISDPVRATVLNSKAVLLCECTVYHPCIGKPTAGLQRSPDTCTFRAKPTNFRPQPLIEEESNWAETFTINLFYQNISHIGKLDHCAN